MNVRLEILENGFSDTAELRDFWLTEWNRVMKSLIGQDISEAAFDAQNYFYVLRSEEKIFGVMSSSWQTTSNELAKDHYYHAWPDSIQYLKEVGIKKFHRMGMIIAKKEYIPSEIKLSPTIIGCGLKFARSLPDCEGVVSFPRVDNIVYRSCVEWGLETIKSDLTMYNAPVNFILWNAKKPFYYPQPGLNSLVNALWNQRTESTSHTIPFQKVA